MSNNGNRYNNEFKADAIRLIKEEKRSVLSVSKDLGVNPQTLRNWIGEDKHRQNSDKVRIAELEAELKAKDRKIADLEITNDILKKATAIFATSNRK